MSEVRMLKLLPEQIAEHWDEIWPAVEFTLPPIAPQESPDRMNRILSAFLSGELELLTFSRVGENAGLMFIVAVCLQRTFESDVITLLVYSLYAYQRASQEEWKEGWDLLISYGKSVGAVAIAGYTDEAHLRAYFRRLGDWENWVYVKKFI